MYDSFLKFLIIKFGQFSNLLLYLKKFSLIEQFKNNKL